jgi:hypothetical protein
VGEIEGYCDGFSGQRAVANPISAGPIHGKGPHSGPRSLHGKSYCGGSASTRGGSVSSSGGSVSGRGGSVSSRGGSVSSRGGSVSSWGASVSSRGASVSIRGASVSSRSNPRERTPPSTSQSPW